MEIAIGLVIFLFTIFLLFEIADVHKTTQRTNDNLFDLHVQMNKSFVMLGNKLSALEHELNIMKEQIADVQAQPELSESSDDFDQRIAEIKNELGLRVQIADEQKARSAAQPLHPNIYNIDEADHAAYEIKQEVEYAR